MYKKNTDYWNSGGIDMVSNYVPLSTLSYAAMTSISAGGRAYLPVDTKQVVYSHFQYVSGVPRTKDQNGISIGKLKILNTLKIMNFGVIFIKKIKNFTIYKKYYLNIEKVINK